MSNNVNVTEQQQEIIFTGLEEIIRNLVVEAPVDVLEDIEDVVENAMEQLDLDQIVANLVQVVKGVL